MFDKVDACLFFKKESIDERSILYFTGVKTDLGILLKTKKKQILYLSSLEEKPKVDFVVKDFDMQTLLDDLKRLKVKTIGLDYGAVTALTFHRLKKHLKGYRIVNISSAMNRLRMKKSKTEITNLRRAAKLTEKIIFEAISGIKKNKFTYEREVVNFIKMRTLELGLIESFPPIVASGKNSRNPHYSPSPKSKIQKGFCVIDYGVKYKGYCADITRTVFLGKPTQEDRDFYNKIKDQLYQVEKEVKAGSKKIKLNFEMIHLLGHGIGLDVHEYPSIGYDKLEVGMCLAIEPALYTKKHGVRIEDDYVLTEKGLKRLSTTSRELQIINK